MRLTGTLARRLAREQDGFTMLAVIGATLLVLALSAAALGAAGGDIGLARYDQDDKQSFAAAEAGINDYLGNLNSDSNYWAKCTGVASPVNDRGATGTTRRWKDVPGSSSRYSIELIPAAGKTRCDPDDPFASMNTDGNIRIRATGNVKGTNNYRTATATFRRAGFLDFLYYTDLENQDPQYIKRTGWDTRQTRPTNGNTPLLDWVGDQCERHWPGSQSDRGQGRGQRPTWTGEVFATYNNRDYWVPISLQTDDVGCGEIQFAPDDEVNGPFHSNDSILICGTASFGSSSNNDRVEVSGTDPGWRAAGGSSCSGQPSFRPSLAFGAASVDPPQSNRSLDSLTLPGYSFTGQTTIVLKGNSMTVTNPALNGGADTDMALPRNGVIFVGNASSGPACGDGYDPTDSKAAPAGCGDVRLSGSYTKDLTIAAENDVIAMNSITRPADDKSLLGLIAGGFARIWHPVNSSCQGQTPTNVRVDAAILALNGSFTVDNYWCGGPLGTLTVNGAIAQEHRGVVGQSGSGGNGYIKNYNYNPDLKFRSPPYFLDPVQASWRILRQGEQSPPQRG